MDSRDQGVVHIIGPELGFTKPGMTITCGDSHTSTHGAFGALAFGVGTSEVEHVLATQTLPQAKSKTFRIAVEGLLPRGVTAKDVILAIIGKIGTDGATGCVIEYAGSAIRSLSMEGRMTVCNMSIEAGARGGMIAPDENHRGSEVGQLHGRHKGRSFTVAELTVAGVRRISLSTSLYRAAVTGFLAAAREVKEMGTFGYLEQTLTTLEFIHYLRG